MLDQCASPTADVRSTYTSQYGYLQVGCALPTWTRHNSIFKLHPSRASNALFFFISFFSIFSNPAKPGRYYLCQISKHESNENAMTPVQSWICALDECAFTAVPLWLLALSILLCSELSSSTKFCGLVDASNCQVYRSLYTSNGKVSQAKQCVHSNSELEDFRPTLENTSRYIHRNCVPPLLYLT